MIKISFWISFLVVTAVLFANIGFAADTSRVNVLDYGAKADSVTDDTAAFKAAFDAVKVKAGTVFVPAGRYMIKTHLDVPDNVTLEGISNYPATGVTGSVLLAVEGAGTEEGPGFVNLKTNSTLKGITIYYPEQKPENLQPYPWCISGAGDNVAIIDCMLVNPYNGIDLGRSPAGRHLVRNVYGNPLRRGLFVDQCYDVGRIENVHFWPFWNTGGWTPEQGGKIGEVMTGQGEAFIFARTDWEYVTNTFSWGYKIGYHFTTSASGGMNGNLLGIGADATEIAILVDNCNSIGLLITNGEFVSFPGENPTEVVVKGTNAGTIQFQNCAFWGPAHQVARIAGTGTVSFNNCNFVEWDAKRTNKPAIEVFGGNLLVNGSNFQYESAPQIMLRDKTQAAVVVGNRMVGPLQVLNTAKADLQIGLNISGKQLERPVEEKDAIVIDDVDGIADVSFIGNWLSTPGRIYYNNGTRWATKGNGDIKAIFTPNVPKTGKYTVYAWFGPDLTADHASKAPVIIKSLDGTSTRYVDLRLKEGQWVKLGDYRFDKGRKGSITMTNAADANILADAVKLVPSKN
ncbi:MAG: golvesin C-terminal-like domain-containing protein [Armatimonadota bacterium]